MEKSLTLENLLEDLDMCLKEQARLGDPLKAKDISEFERNLTVKGMLALYEQQLRQTIEKIIYERMAKDSSQDADKTNVAPGGTRS